jgi:hypothetical protein
LYGGLEDLQVIPECSHIIVGCFGIGYVLVGIGIMPGIGVPEVDGPVQIDINCIVFNSIELEGKGK